MIEITLEEFIGQTLQYTERFMAEWKGHKDDSAWPNEMKKQDWLEQLILAITEYDREQEQENYIGSKQYCEGVALVQSIWRKYS